MSKNEVLRPILKLQNDLFISFKNYSAKYNDFFSNYREKLATIENAIQKDSKYRNTFWEWYWTIHDRGIFLHQEFIKSQQKNDDDAN
jgi:hypothetical protein